MALKYCHECKGVVSTEAKACPHCGAKVKRNQGCALAALSLVLVVIFIGFFSSPTSKTPASQDQETSTLEPEINTWKYDSRTDSVSGKDSRSMYVKSNNQHELDFPYSGGTYGILEVRKHPRFGTDLIFNINKGQLICRLNNCSITMRIDEQPAIKVNVSEPEDHSRTTFFLNGSKNLIEKIKKSNKVIIEATFYSEGNRDFEFNTGNLDLDWIKGK